GRALSRADGRVPAPRSGARARGGDAVNEETVGLAERPARKSGNVPIPAFSGYGIELEYAIVDRESLDVHPVADRLLATMAGRATSDVVRGALGWSNELSLHVIELKNRKPARTLETLPGLFAEEIRNANRVLSSMSACLMPTGAHPWMNPRAETLLWPHE